MQAAEEPEQLRGTTQDCVRSALCQNGAQPAELDQVSGSLLRVKKDSFAGQVLAGPAWFGEFWIGVADPGLEQAPFIFAPSIGKIPGQQEDARKVNVRCRIVGPNRDGFAKGGDCLVEPVAVAKSLSKIDQSGLKVGPRGKRTPVRLDRAIRLAQCLEGDAHVHHRFEIIRP